MSEEEVKPIVTQDSITIPRFGGERQTLPLPKGSQALVTQYIENEQLEKRMDEAIETLVVAKKIISNTRQSLGYELMGRAQNFAAPVKKTKEEKLDGKPASPKKSKKQ